MPPDEKSWILLVCVVVSGIKIDSRRCSELPSVRSYETRSKVGHAAPSMRILAKRTCPLMRTMFSDEPEQRNDRDG